MNKVMKSFREVLLGAKAGNEADMNMLYLICKDVLDSGSRIDGVENDELKSLILYRFVLAVKRFML